MKWEQLDSEYVFESKFLKVRKDVVKLPNGLVMDDYMIVEKKNVSLIVAVDEEKRILLKVEYRYPIDKCLIELPGGTFELGEKDSLKVAKRELLEETGYESDEWELLYANYDYPTKDINQVNIYLAKNIRKVAEQQLDISEEIEYKLVELDKAVEMCMDNSIAVNGSIAGILKVARIYGI